MKILSLFSLSLLLMLASCTNKNKQTESMSPDNPFAKPSTLAFQTADFSKIKDGDFKPAIEEGIKQQLDEVNKIADNADAPTFENTLVELEKSGQLLRRAQ